MNDFRSNQLPYYLYETHAKDHRQLLHHTVPAIAFVIYWSLLAGAGLLLLIGAVR